MKIAEISSRKVLASRGDWTIETTIVLEDGSYGIASVPAGISTGKGEAKTLLAAEALAVIKEKLTPELVNKDFPTLKDFDAFLIGKDGTPDKSNLGGNTVLSLSVAFAKAAAMFSESAPLYSYLNQLVGGTPVRIPEFLVLVFEGGLHARSLLSIQEFAIKCQTVEEALSLYKRVAEAMKIRNLPDLVGAEGAFSPPGMTNDDCLSLLSSLFGPGCIALDLANSHLLGSSLNLEELVSKYAPFSLEDIYDEEAWDNWEVFSKNNSGKVLVVADDLVVTNKIRLQKLIEKKAARAVVVKPNQIGTVSETLEFVQLAKKSGLKTVVSHRGEDTNDDFIADLAVAVGSDYVKFGGTVRGERVAKYNRILEITDELK
jgi:enolase